MGLLNELLLEKKIFEAKNEIDQFLEDKGVEDGSLLQRIDFDQSVYENEDLVRDFLRAHYLEHMKVDKTKSGFTALLYDEIGFIASTMKSIEVRDGLFIVVGILKPMDEENPFFFKLSDEGMKFAESLPSVIELATVIKGFHFNYGEVEITKQHLKKFKENFESKSYGIDISIDFDHETREAAGWIKEVFLSDDGNKLYGVVRWTPKGALALNDREFRYFSPEFNLNFIHPHTGVNHGPTLMGGALVNRPFLKMDAIVGLKDKHSKGAKVETIALSEHKTKVSGLEKEISELKLSENTLKNTNKELEGKNTQLSDELKTLKAKVIKQEAEAKHQKLFDEGKINASQLKALNEGKDLFEVLSLSEKLNDKPAGGEHDTKQIQLSDVEAKLCKKLGLTPEEYVEANKGDI